jgi:hypothetical protein
MGNARNSFELLCVNRTSVWYLSIIDLFHVFCFCLRGNNIIAVRVVGACPIQNLTSPYSTERRPKPRFAAAVLFLCAHNFIYRQDKAISWDLFVSSVRFAVCSSLIAVPVHSQEFSTSQEKRPIFSRTFRLSRKVRTKFHFSISDSDT